MNNLAITLPSNGRKNDKSCHNLVGSSFHQCFTCDPGGKLLICKGCLKNGDHDCHQILSLFQFKLNNTINSYCNCGDSSGLIFCKNHAKSKLLDNERPLYNNNQQMNVFIRLFDLNLKEFLPLANQCQIHRVQPGSPDGKLVNFYFENSKLSTKVDIKIRTIWSLYRKDRELLFVRKGYEKYRRMLLWHGTKNKNLTGILENGLKLPQGSDTVANGSMFGLGVYFSDRVSKSAQYCEVDGEGIVFLCEVSLGSMWREGKATNYKNVPKNFHSIKGVGKYKPDPNGNILFDESIIVPAGKTIANSHPDIKGSHLNYNEYIVFDPERILIKFIVQIGLKK